MRLPRCLSVMLACSMAAAATLPPAGDRAKADDPAPAAGELKKNIRKAWRTGIEAPEDAESPCELDEAIRKLEAMRLAPKPRVKQAASAPMTAPVQAVPDARPDPPTAPAGLLDAERP